MAEPVAEEAERVVVVFVCRPGYRGWKVVAGDGEWEGEDTDVSLSGGERCA